MVYGPKHFRKAHFHKLPKGWKPSLLIKQASKHSELMTSLLKLALTVTSLVGAGPMTSSTGSQRPLMLRALLSGWLMCVYSALESHSCLKNTFQCVPSSSLSPGPDMQQTNSVISVCFALYFVSWRSQVGNVTVVQPNGLLLSVMLWERGWVWYFFVCVRVFGWTHCFLPCQCLSSSAH